jgi:16S rRNA (guanine966-N2)-methyltransferase
LRVIGGTFGGRRLRAVEGHRTRPTSDRVREALFSRIEARFGFAGSSVLDLFAGTGALAIEAISRGASRAVCVEMERRALETLKDNVRELELASQVRVIGDDFRRVLARLRPFDGVFVDPPYGKGLAIDALGALAELGLVKDGGWVSVETFRREQLPDIVRGPAIVLSRLREDTYGDTKLSLYEARAATDESAVESGAAPAEVTSASGAPADSASAAAGPAESTSAAGAPADSNQAGGSAAGGADE